MDEHNRKNAAGSKGLRNGCKKDLSLNRRGRVREHLLTIVNTKKYEFHRKNAIRVAQN